MRVLPHHLLTEVVGLAPLQDGVRRAADQDLQVGGGEWLGEVVPGAHPERLDAARHGRIAGHHDHQGVPVGLEGGVEDFQPGHLRHEEINQDQVELPPADELHRLLAASREGDGVAFAAQNRRATLPEGPFVVDDQDPDRGLHVGRKCKQIAASRAFRRTEPGPGDGSHGNS
jgi:hypothetical protein